MIEYIRNRLMEREAERDARHGIDSTELRLQAALGKKPEWDPVENAEHAEIAQTLGDRAELEELRADRRKAEDEIARHPSPTVLLALLALTSVIEAFGGILIMKSLGRENPERTFLGIALAIGTLGFTAFVSRTASETTQPGMTPRRTLGALVLLAVYTVFVLAVAFVRVEPAEGEETSGLTSYAEAVLMLATTVLPAFTAEWLFRRREPAVLARRALRNIERRLRRLEARRARAVKYVRDLARRRERFEQAEARRVASYRVAHRLASAREEYTALPAPRTHEEESG